MFFATYFILPFISFVLCSDGSTTESPRKKMMGIDTVRHKIDKDTIITRNLKLDSRKKAVKVQEEEPDWTYKSFPPEVNLHVLEFKKNMTECLIEVQHNNSHKLQRLSPGKLSPVHGECLISCVLKRNKVLDKNKINKENLLNLVGKFYSKDTKLMKKLEKNVDHCIDKSKGILDECRLAAHLNDCTNDLMTNNKHRVVVKY